MICDKFSKRFDAAAVELCGFGFLFLFFNFMSFIENTAIYEHESTH